MAKTEQQHDAIAWIAESSPFLSENELAAEGDRRIAADE